MAFALTKYEARSVEIASPSYKRGIQEVVLSITAAATDVDLDIGDDGGTFWTAALANATYGALASKALESLNRIVDQSTSLMAVMSMQLIDRVQVATLTTTGQYTLAVQDKRPNIAFTAADGETAFQIILRYELNHSVFPEIALYGESTY